MINLEKKDGDNPASKSVISAHHISSNCQSIDETLVIPVSCTVSDVYTEQNEGAIHLKSNVVSKKGKIILTKKIRYF